MLPLKVDIKGLIRFSYLSEGGFALSNQDENAIRDTLYDPERLVRRFALFERLTLHSIKQQLEPRFRIGILIGEDFPNDARAWLERLVSDVPQVQVISLPRLPHFNATRRAFDMMGNDPEATHTATFRLDDDDAMHRLTTDRIMRMSQTLLATRNPTRPFIIGFNRGFYLDAGNSETPLTEWFEKTPLGIGLTLVMPKGMLTNIYRRNHRKLGEYYDSYIENGQPMYIRSVHEDNDSHAKATGRRGELDHEGIARVLRRGFNLTLNDLRALNVS